MGQTQLEQYKTKLRRFYESHRRMPSYKEMADLLSFASKNAAYELASRLIDDGFCGKDSRGKLIPHNLYGDVKRLGIVEAGFPSPAEEDLSDRVTLDEWLIKDRESSYLLEVKGNSMIDASIREGDTVLVERTEKWKVGDIVIAEVDGEFTMKYLRKNNKGYYLEAANEDYADIWPEGALNIVAVVRAVLRKY